MARPPLRHPQDNWCKLCTSTACAGVFVVVYVCAHCCCQPAGLFAFGRKCFQWVIREGFPVERKRKRRDPQRVGIKRGGRGEAEKDRTSLEILLVTLRAETSEHRSDRILPWRWLLFSSWMPSVESVSKRNQYDCFSCCAFFFRRSQTTHSRESKVIRLKLDNDRLKNLSPNFCFCCNVNIPFNGNYCWHVFFIFFIFFFSSAAESCSLHAAAMWTFYETFRLLSHCSAWFDFAVILLFVCVAVVPVFWFAQTALLARESEDIPGAPIAVCVLACPAFCGWNEC